MRLKTLLASLCTATVLAGCAVGPDYVRPKPDLPVAWQAWPDGGPSGTVVDQWWREFRDPQLDDLVARAIRDGLDVKIALARIAQARAQARITGADVYPTVATRAESRRLRESKSGDLIEELAASGIDVPLVSTERSVRVVIGYEIDLWGRAYRAAQAAGAEYQASVEDAEATRILVAAEVAEAYFEVRYHDERRSIKSALIEIELEHARRLHERHAAGLVSDAKLLEHRAELAQLEAVHIDLSRRRIQAENRLAVLLGASPGELKLPMASLRASVVVPVVPAGVPSTLLERRPDIRAAEQRLIAANARIGEAKAALFPSISLTGFRGFQSDEFKKLTSSNNRIWGYRPEIHLPLFEGGQLRARVKGAEAGYEQAAIEYRQTIRRALLEVENALGSVESRTRQQANLKRAEEALAGMIARAGDRFDRGLVSRLEVLQAERSKLVVEELQLDIHREMLRDTIALNKALGAGFAALHQP